MTAKCPCEHCGVNIEFSTEEFQSGSTVACPTCGKDTSLYISPQAKPPQPLAAVRPLNDEARCNCQRCGKSLAFPPHMVGQDVTCPHCGRETTLLLPRIEPSSAAVSVPAKDSAHGDVGGLVAAGVLTAICLPLVGFIIGIILLAKNQIGSGITCIIVSIVCFGIALAIFLS